VSRVVLLDPPLDAAKTAAPRLGPLSYCRPGTAAPSLRPMRGGLTTRVLQRRLTGWGNGVFVLGMHRSGTSAATRVINLMGLPLGDATDLIEPDAGNPAGFWESSRLVAVNDELLELLGGTWSDPPPLSSGWERSRRLDSLRREARRVFAETYRSRDWVWKDPRNCLTLPFWRSVLRGRSCAIIVLRHPLEIASSLEARDDFRFEQGMALWERYLTDALSGSQGMPLLVTRYEQLLEDPAAWCRRTGTFLAERGFAVTQPTAATLHSFLDPGLRHASLSADDLARSDHATPSQRRLYSEILDLAGGLGLDAVPANLA